MSRYRTPRFVSAVSIVLGWVMALGIAVFMALALLRIIPPSLFVLSLIQLTPFLVLGIVLATLGHIAGAVFDIADSAGKPGPHDAFKPNPLRGSN